MSERFDIRPMVRWDLPAVLAIERAGFETPWTAEELECAFDDADAFKYVATHFGTVVGYSLFAMEKCSKSVLLDTIAVKPAAQRKGIGTSLLDHARWTGEIRRGTTAVIAGVNEKNLAGQLFLAAAGYRCTQIVPDLDGSTFGRRFTAYVFEWDREWRGRNRVARALV